MEYLEWAKEKSKTISVIHQLCAISRALISLAESAAQIAAELKRANDKIEKEEKNKLNYEISIQKAHDKLSEEK